MLRQRGHRHWHRLRIYRQLRINRSINRIPRRISLRSTWLICRRSIRQLRVGRRYRRLFGNVECPPIIDAMVPRDVARNVGIQADVTVSYVSVPYTQMLDTVPLVVVLSWPKFLLITQSVTCLWACHMILWTLIVLVCSFSLP